MARFDGSNWTSYTPANSGLPEPYIYSIAAGVGTVYFGTARTGCAGFDGLDGKVQWTRMAPSPTSTATLGRITTLRTAA